MTIFEFRGSNLNGDFYSSFANQKSKMPKDTGLDYKQLATAFEHQNFKPLYFLFGEETFQIDELQALLIETALRPHERDFNFDLVYGAEAEAQEVLALCAGYPAGAERRVVVVRDFDKLKGNRAFKAYAEQPNPQAVVFLACATKPNLSAHPYRALRELAAWGQFKTLYDNQIPGWIQRRAEAQGYRMEPEAVQMLADYVGTDLQAIAGEIEKLITFAGGRTTLTGDDVIKASGQTREFNVFELQKAVGERRPQDALRIAQKMLGQATNAQSEALMIVAVLNAYFTKLWKLPGGAARRMSNNEVARRIGVSPYFAKEYVAAAGRFSRGAIERAFSALLAADYELKGGSRRDAVLIVTLLLRQIAPSEAAVA